VGFGKNLAQSGSRAVLTLLQKGCGPGRAWVFLPTPWARPEEGLHASVFFLRANKTFWASAWILIFRAGDNELSMENFDKLSFQGWEGVFEGRGSGRENFFCLG